MTWHLIPMAIIISLVYNASRYELPQRILRSAANLFVKIILFMGAIFLLLLFLSYNL